MVTLCFSIMQQCDTRFVFSASCPFFLTLHWFDAVWHVGGLMLCCPFWFPVKHNQIRVKMEAETCVGQYGYSLHIQSKICRILLHRPLQMCAFCFSEGRGFDAFIKWQSRVIYAYLKRPTIRHRRGTQWLSMAVVTDKKCVCVESFGHMTVLANGNTSRRELQ